MPDLEEGWLNDMAEKQRLEGQRAKKLLREMLAVIHGDGGQYATKHGLDKATADALDRYYALVKENEELRHWSLELTAGVEAMTEMALSGVAKTAHPGFEQRVEYVGALLQRAEAAEARFTAPIVCMCGSTRFKQSWIAENARLSLEGNTVLAVGLWGHHERKFPDAATKAQLDAWHKCKIDLCDWVWVLDVGGYLGESTRSEIEYAEKLGRPVRYLSQEFPDYVEPTDPLQEELDRERQARQRAEKRSASLRETISAMGKSNRAEALEQERDTAREAADGFAKLCHKLEARVAELEKELEKEQFWHNHFTDETNVQRDLATQLDRELRETAANLAKEREASIASENSKNAAAQELAEIDTALGNGADEELWPPGMTRAEAICRLKAERDELLEIGDGTDLDECIGERDIAERERDVMYADLMVAKAKITRLHKQLEEAGVEIAWETQVVEEDLFQRLEEAEEGERAQRARAEKAEANYQFMVNRAADEKLDGYRELGARAADAERRADQASAATREAHKWGEHYERLWKAADAELERLRRENQRLLEEHDEH